jgi:endonuclease YncB( thermonuclease family)
MRRLATAIVTALFGAIIVIDGDTVEMDGKRYRLLGFDTPETYWAKSERERQRGDAATARLKDLLSRHPARLVPTGKSCRYRRECAHLYIGGEDVARIMIREGHAVPYGGKGRRPDWSRK